MLQRLFRPLVFLFTTSALAACADQAVCACDDFPPVELIGRGAVVSGHTATLPFDLIADLPVYLQTCSANVVATLEIETDTAAGTWASVPHDQCPVDSLRLVGTDTIANHFHGEYSVTLSGTYRYRVYFSGTPELTALRNTTSNPVVVKF